MRGGKLEICEGIELQSGERFWGRWVQISRNPREGVMMEKEMRDKLKKDYT